MKADLFAVVDNGAVQAVPFVVIEHVCHPRGKGRPRGRIVKPRHGPMFINFYTDSDTVDFERALAWRAEGAMKGRPPLEGPLAIRIYAMMPIPKSWPNRDRDAALAGTKFHMSTPDVDNIGKICLDSLNGIVWSDDKQVVRVYCHKEYAENPGLIIETFKLP
jgi:Holliday junction resolvase RusA-like endonuclease